MASDKHRAVWDWLQTCPYIGDLFFVAADARIGITVLTPSDQVIEEYIDDSTKRNYNCSLTRFQPFTMDPNDAASITAVTDLEDLLDWVRRQNRRGNYPVFPADCHIEEIRVLPNESGYMVFQDAATAKYMIQFQIVYRQEPVEDEDPEPPEELDEDKEE